MSSIRLLLEHTRATHRTHSPQRRAHNSALNNSAVSVHDPMALYRSKLRPVGGGRKQDGKPEGGIAVDLDPLSAFALMGRGGSEESQATSTVQPERKHKEKTHPSIARSPDATKPRTPVPRRDYASSAEPTRLGTASAEGTRGIRRTVNGNVPALSKVRCDQ